MFDVSWTELMVIAVVAIVVIGPKDLPRALRTLGQWTSKIKRMAHEFQNQFTEAIREAELDAVQRDIEELTKIDPVADLRAAANETGESIKRDLDKATPREPYPWEVKVGDSTAAAPAVAPADAAAPATPESTSVPAPAPAAPAPPAAAETKP